MIAKKGLNNQLPKTIKATFDELGVLKHLREAGIKKTFGFSCAYLFQLVFCLIFEQKNWYQLLESKKSFNYPAKGHRLSLFESSEVCLAPLSALFECEHHSKSERTH